MLVAPVERMKPIGAFRIAAITSRPDPFRTRLASSLKVTSRDVIVKTKLRSTNAPVPIRATDRRRPFLGTLGDEVAGLRPR